MGLFDLLPKKSEEIIIDAESVEEESFMESAEKTALIVTESIENNQIANVSDDIMKYLGEYKGKERVVFQPLPVKIWILLFVIGIICSLLFLWFLPIAAGTVLYSDKYRMRGIYIILAVMVIILVNGYICWKSLVKIRFTKRYMNYYSVLQYKNVELIDGLARMTNSQRVVVEKDLKNAVKEKLIPQGHFGQNNVCFMVTDEAFTKYSINKSAYDRYYKQLLESRNTDEKQVTEAEALLSQGEELLGKILDGSTIIKSKEVADKLCKMNYIIATAFHEIDINPAGCDKLGIFIYCYLPATEKLLELYKETNRKKIAGEDLQKPKGEIIQALDSINSAFESLLVKFYDEQEIDIENEISTMELIINQENLLTE